MRVWDLPPELLCRNHLLGEHRELHALWAILTQDKKGYRKHPETIRWKGKLKALYRRHDLLVAEMASRNYSHHSPLDPKFATGQATQTVYVDLPARQRQLLKCKKCACRV